MNRVASGNKMGLVANSRILVLIARIAIVDGGPPPLATSGSPRARRRESRSPWPRNQCRPTAHRSKGLFGALQERRRARRHGTQRRNGEREIAAVEKDAPTAARSRKAVKAASEKPRRECDAAQKAKIFGADSQPIHRLEKSSQLAHGQPWPGDMRRKGH